MSINRVSLRGKVFLRPRFCETQWLYIRVVWLIYLEAFSPQLLIPTWPPWLLKYAALKFRFRGNEKGERMHRQN